MSGFWYEVRKFLDRLINFHEGCICYRTNGEFWTGNKLEWVYIDGIKFVPEQDGEQA